MGDSSNRGVLAVDPVRLGEGCEIHSDFAQNTSVYPNQARNAVESCGAMGDEDLSMKQLLKFMKAAEKRRELDTAALSEKLGAIQIAQEELAGSWKPKVDQAIWDLSSAVDFLKERVEHIDRQVTTAVARLGHGAAAPTPAAAVARAGHGVVNLVQLQPSLGRAAREQLAQMGIVSNWNTGGLR